MGKPYFPSPFYNLVTYDINSKGRSHFIENNLPEGLTFLSILLAKCCLSFS